MTPELTLIENRRVLADAHEEPVRTPVWRRWGHALVGLFAAEVRAATPEELRLRAKVRELEAHVGDLEGRIFRQQHDLKVLESEKQIQALEIKTLALVNERDRARIQAELAQHTAGLALTDATLRTN